jgi:hypothetical protein
MADFACSSSLPTQGNSSKEGRLLEVMIPEAGLPGSQDCFLILAVLIV